MTEAIREERGWDSIPFPEYEVGRETAGFHTDDRAYWRAREFNRSYIMNKRIYSVGKDGIIYFKDGLLPFGTKVKIQCVHKR